MSLHLPDKNNIPLHQVALNPTLLLDTPLDIKGLSSEQKKDLALRINSYIEKNVDTISPSPNNIKDIKRLVDVFDELNGESPKKNLFSRVLKKGSSEEITSKTIDQFKKSHSSFSEIHEKSDSMVIKDELTLAEEELVDQLNRGGATLLVHLATHSQIREKVEVEELSKFVKDLGKSKDKITTLDLTKLSIQSAGKKKEPKQIKELLKTVDSCPNLTKLVFSYKDFPINKFLSDPNYRNIYIIINEPDKNTITFNRVR